MKARYVTPAVASLLFVAAVTSHAATGIVTANAFVRSAPSGNSAPVGSVPKGTSVDFAFTPGNAKWLKIHFNGKDAYVAKKVVKVSTPAQKVAKVETPVAAKPAATVIPATPVFEIVPDISAEELRLKEENSKQALRIKDLEAEIPALQQEVATLKKEVQSKADQVAKYHAMFPYIKVIESVENDGKDVLLTGIGKARMMDGGKQIIVRLEGDVVSTGDRIMKGVAKERYQTGGERTRVYYVLNSQSIKSTNKN